MRRVCNFIRRHWASQRNMAVSAADWTPQAFVFRLSTLTFTSLIIKHMTPPWKRKTNRKRSKNTAVKNTQYLIIWLCIDSYSQNASSMVSRWNWTMEKRLYFLNLCQTHISSRWKKQWRGKCSEFLQCLVQCIANLFIGNPSITVWMSNCGSKSLSIDENMVKLTFCIHWWMI